jgi:hypothetical protein
MGIIFDFGDEPEKMQPGTRIIFNKLDFIADRFGDLRSQEPELTEREEEQSLQIRGFAAGLEKAVDEGPLAIARHLTRHGRLFVEPGQEPRLNATLFLRKIGDPVPITDAVPNPIHSRSPIRPFPILGSANAHGDDFPDPTPSGCHATSGSPTEDKKPFRFCFSVIYFLANPRLN